MNRNYIKRIFTLLLCAAALMAFAPAAQASAETPAGTIDSFETVTLHLSGMRFTTEYEIVMNGKDAEVTEYEIRYEKEKGDVRVPQRKAVCSAGTALKLLNDCELLAWDGFFGAHPKDVKDGIMFLLKATVNGGKNIRAEGSENFPEHFREFWHGLDAILRSKNE